MLRRLTALHRWIGLVIGLQVLAWSAGGVYFAWNDIESVRGDDLRRKSQTEISLASLRLPAHEVPVRSLRLLTHREQPVWELGFDEDPPRYVSAIDGTEMAPVGEAEARAAVESGLETTAPIASIERIEGEPPMEYREKPMPAWRIELDDSEHTRVYVDAASGAITAIRSDSWRWWDFLWMLHIMDYRAREDMHHPLLLGAAVLAFLTAASGLTLWAARLVTRLRKRARHSQVAEDAVSPRS